MINEKILAWLLSGDVSIQYQTYRDLLDTDNPELRKRIASEGWGLKFLSLRNENGHWGQKFYQPKWTSTHYTLLDLKNLNISPNNELVIDTLNKIMSEEKSPDGGILPSGSTRKSDVCINGMVLNYSAYFQIDEKLLESIIDFLLTERMHDGGFNCQSNRKGANHSSLHTTLSVIEGILEYQKNGYTYRGDELNNAKLASQEFILMHKLFRSDKTGNIINPNFLKLRYPGRWYYDILRALDYFRLAEVKYDSRMSEAIEIILSKRTKDAYWKLASKHPGQTHFEICIILLQMFPYISVRP